MYKTLPAVYETAHTRLFYHGRTETVRSLTNESLEFCKIMESKADVRIVHTCMYRLPSYLYFVIFILM